jgi:uncharacterized RDD family membrane protein YckC
MIYLWNIDRLKFDLADNRIPKKHTLIYLTCILAYQIATWSLACFTGDGLNLWDYIDAAASVLFMAGGIGYCFHVNNGRKGSNFSARFISLAWVFGLRYMIMIEMTLSLVLYMVLSRTAGMPDESQWYDALFNAVLRVPFYIFLARHIRDVALNRVLSWQEITEQEEEYDQDFDQSKYPSILRRYMSTFIDVVFILLIFIAMVHVVRGQDFMYPRTLTGIGVVALFFYEPLFTSRFCTIGQRAMGIRVRKTDSGERISIPDASLRSIVKLLLGIVSFFFIPVTRKRRALHDFAAGTVVTYAGMESMPAGVKTS